MNCYSYPSFSLYKRDPTIQKSFTTTFKNHQKSMILEDFDNSATVFRLCSDRAETVFRLVETVFRLCSGRAENCVQIVFRSPTLCSDCVQIEPRRVQIVFRSSRDCVQIVFRLCSNRAENCVQIVQIEPRLCSDCVQIVFRLCSDCIQIESGLCSDCEGYGHLNTNLNTI